MSIVFVLLILVPFFLCVPLLIGIYVYRDAKRRGMNGALWALIAVIVPALMGFVVYLLTRSGHSDLKCPRCGEAVTEQFLVCPRCGAKLKPSCPRCSMTVEAHWKLCPHCAANLPEEPSDHTPPVRHRDLWLGKILLAVVLIPLALLLLLAAALSTTNGAGAMNTTYFTADSYLEAKAEHWSDKEYTEVSQWLDGCLSDPERAYVLRHKAVRDGEQIIQYLIYYPAAEENKVIESDHEAAFLHTDLTVDFQTTEEPTGYDLCTVSIYANHEPKLRIMNNGKKIEHEITDVTYGLTIFEMLSEN